WKSEFVSAFDLGKEAFPPCPRNPGGRASGPVERASVDLVAVLA
ncbi:4121_t:CDS:2, partial [Gigaspora margarita]